MFFVIVVVGFMMLGVWLFYGFVLVSVLVMFGGYCVFELSVESGVWVWSYFGVYMVCDGVGMWEFDYGIMLYGI